MAGVTRSVWWMRTKYVERQNLTMRMSMRRFTRLTNAFSKKVANHEAAVALHFMHFQEYGFSDATEPITVPDHADQYPDSVLEDVLRQFGLLYRKPKGS